MTNKEVLSLNIMGKNISIACPPEDKPGLEAAAELLNNDIESIPDKSNALILASLNLAFKQMTQPLACLLYTSPSPRDRTRSRMPSSA